MGEWKRMSIKFCKRCSQLLHPKKDSSIMRYICPKCGKVYEECDFRDERSPSIPNIKADTLRRMIRDTPSNDRINDRKDTISDGSESAIDRPIQRKKIRKKNTSKPPEGFPIFPFEVIREGQVDFLRDCEKAFSKGMHLVAYAPTGIGKTVASLVPALETALRKNKTILFLTSKQSQHRMAVETLREIYENSPHLRELLERSSHHRIASEKARSGATNLIVVDVISKQDMCPRDFAGEFHAVFNEFCKMEKKMKRCPYIKGKGRNTYRKIEEGILHVEELVNVATSNMLCPHGAALEVAQYAHVIVCDYNYLFSDMADAMLEKMALGPGNIIAIVDEAHNLPDRIRGHLSGDITSNRIRDALSELQEVDTQLHHFVKQMKGSFSRMFSSIGEGREAVIDKTILIGEVESILKSTLDGPTDFKEFYGRLIEEGEKRLDAGQAMNSILHLGEFFKIWDQDLPGTVRFGSTKGTGTLSYRLLDPSVISKDVFGALYSAVLMSGTLFPPRMYADVLGLEHDRTVLREYLSPFPRKNRPVYVMSNVTTLYKRRNPEMYARIADHIRNATEAASGNAAVFFPSYALLQEIEFELMEMRPGKPLVIEERGMKKVEKERLYRKLDRLQYMGGATLLGVQGGSFSEGIDYPGGLLNMVIIVGIPLAPPSLEVELLISYYKRLFGQSRGYKYSYLLPALSRVLQAAGRCIRSEEDRGVVILMDRRFGQSNFAGHYPRDFKTRSTDKLFEEVEEFFAV